MAKNETIVLEKVEVATTAKAELEKANAEIVKYKSKAASLLTHYCSRKKRYKKGIDKLKEMRALHLGTALKEARKLLIKAKLDANFLIPICLTLLGMNEVEDTREDIITLLMISLLIRIHRLSSRIRMIVRHDAPIPSAQLASSTTLPT
ncbi:hypothetical protein HS088_TW11G00621 [Tripterygium wilfordii]|uniref:Uncharacterized protein n=1 Tax=Tripterygium wilfordii TaxID=458696 RepID=A0A7J7D2S5_TRIWF|nr:hypothetical protein HS088_TW11G00621 [Tripterygium wilfordii]